MIFNKVFALLAILTVAYSLPSSVQEHKRETYPDTVIEVTVPAHSKYVNPKNETDTFWGPQTKRFPFNSDPAIPQLEAIGFTWITYDQSKDAEKLEDEDRQYNMTCYANLFDAEPAGTQHKIEIGTKAPYIKSLSDEPWDKLVKVANVVCPEGKCIKEGGCKGLEIPKWDQGYLDKYVKP